MSEDNKAPVDFFIKMHDALVSKDYKIALNYCNTILSYEQQNETMKTFHELLTKKLDMMDEETDCSETDSISDSSNSNTDEDYENDT